MTARFLRIRRIDIELDKTQAKKSRETLAAFLDRLERSVLTLGVLSRLTRLAQTNLLSFNFTRISRQEARTAQR